MFHPSEPLLPDGRSIAAIAVAYPERGLAVLGWRVRWMVIYAPLSMVCAFGLARRYRITI